MIYEIRKQFMNDLYRLVYTSFRKSNCDEKEIENILNVCKRNNPGRDVTGILMHSKSRFIQYIEGAKKEVEALYELIKDDPRHTSVNLRSMERIDERVFPSWEMGYKDLENEGLAFQTDATQEDKQAIEKIINSELDFTNEGVRVLQLFFESN